MAVSPTALPGATRCKPLTGLYQFWIAFNPRRCRGIPPSVAGGYSPQTPNGVYISRHRRLPGESGCPTSKKPVGLMASSPQLPPQAATGGIWMPLTKITP